MTSRTRTFTRTGRAVAGRMSRMPGRPPARVAWALALSVLLAGCSDPGSGGSGVPGAAATPAPVDAPAVGSRTITGTIEALDATTLTIAGNRIDTTRAIIVRSDGSAASASDLRTGQAVTVTLADEGAVAVRIVIH